MAAGSELAGHVVAVTRPEEGGHALARLLAQHGARTLTIPLVSVVPAADDTALRSAVERLGTYDWVVFTSSSAVRVLAALTPGAQPPDTLIAVVGDRTAAAVQQELSWRVDVVPDRFSGTGLAVAMLERAPVRGTRVLWPRARDARPELPRELRSAGALLDDIEAYRTVPLPLAADRLRDLVARREVTVLTFTSPSAVDAFAADYTVATGSVLVAAIGPSTAQAALQQGLPVHVQPDTFTAAGLVDALLEYVRVHGGDA